jgi:hypothetical protein
LIDLDVEIKWMRTHLEILQPRIIRNEPIDESSMLVNISGLAYSVEHEDTSSYTTKLSIRSVYAIDSRVA